MGGVLSAKKGEESVPSGEMKPNEIAKQPKPEKLFFLAGHHSRNSSTSSSLSSETEREVKEEKEGDKEKGCRITGGCLCKISLLVYLMVCIIVSALYVAIYGQNQQLFGEVWIPGKVMSTITRGCPFIVCRSLDPLAVWKTPSLIPGPLQLCFLNRVQTSGMGLWQQVWRRPGD